MLLWRVILLWFLLCGSLAESAWAQKKPATPPISPARAAIAAVLAERDRAFAARDATAYFALCTADYVHQDALEDTFPLDKLRTELQKQLTAAKTAEQKTQIDSFKLDGTAAVVETYENVKLLSYAHEWLEITGTGYRRCRYRFILDTGKWRLARTRVLEETLTEKPRLLESPGLTDLEKRVKSPEVQAIVRKIYPLLEELATAEERHDFKIFQQRLAPDFAFIRLGKDPETRQSYIEKETLAHQFISGDQVRYYLMGAELQENGDLTLEVEQATRYTITLPDEVPEKNLIILSLVLTWTKLADSWYIKRWEHFTAEGFENDTRVDFVQKEKNKKK